MGEVKREKEKVQSKEGKEREREGRTFLLSGLFAYK